MCERDKIVLVKGKDRTNDISSFQFVGKHYDVIYKDTPKVYSYNPKNVTVLTDCLSDERCRNLFEYFKETASAVSLVADSDAETTNRQYNASAQPYNILGQQYNKIKSIRPDTVLAKYFQKDLSPEIQNEFDFLIYPFGLNQSQKIAVENAFSSQVSIIQGPPGTGKTQTILNIIANAVLNEKTVAVVSNNNSATENVLAKLEKKGFSFLTAFLGSTLNKQKFIENQTGKYPNFESWSLSGTARQKLKNDISRLTKELNVLFDSKNRIAEINRELSGLETEIIYFNVFFSKSDTRKIELQRNKLTALSSEKAAQLWCKYENALETGLRIFDRIRFVFSYGFVILKVMKHRPEDVVAFLQNLYYQSKRNELLSEKQSLEDILREYPAKMEELSSKSTSFFKAALARRYQHSKDDRKRFCENDLRSYPDEFNKEYPVVLSTTYSIKKTLSPEHIFDYLIIDEASQVDLATGVLAFSCAKNVIIVGDQKQLPNILTKKIQKIADEIWRKYSLDEPYRFSAGSLLESATKIWQGVPTVLLREHYRCHPKIAEFFNQKFYNNELLVMTEDHGEKYVLSIHRTVPGNHARGHVNQRQIDVILQEILPSLFKYNFNDIGIIAPYRDQVTTLQKQLGDRFEIDTVHKFQGREKEAVILCSVDNIIGDFVNQPDLFNVAVSRAIKSLSVVISLNKENEKTNYGDLAKYIEYNNFQINDSKLYSIFDLLYKEYGVQRKKYLENKKKISEYDSENLAFSVIEEILQLPEFSNVACAVHVALRTVLSDYSLLTVDEKEYASNPLTHFDFVLYSKMSKFPVLALEIDGTRFHSKESKQAQRDILKNEICKKYNIPLLRIKTNESAVKSKIVAALNNATC